MTDLQTAFQETGEQLDRIIAAFIRKPYRPRYTMAYYSDGSKTRYDIVGTLNSNSIDKTDLVKIDIGEGVLSVGDNAFQDCSTLREAVLGSAVIGIGTDGFTGCVNLSSIACYSEFAPIAGSGTTELFGSCFGGRNDDWVGRNSYSLGTNVLRVPIGSIGYDNDDGWHDPLKMPDKCGFHIEYSSECGVFDRVKTAAFYSDGRREQYDIVGTLNRGDVLSTDLTSIVVGTAVTAIGNSAFENVASLEKCCLSTSVISIGNAAFKNCSSIDGSNFNYSAQVYIGEEAFAGCNAIMLTLTDTMSIGTNAFATNSQSLLMAPFNTQAEIQTMSNYSWGLPSGSVIMCSDGYLTVS